MMSGRCVVVKATSQRPWRRATVSTASYRSAPASSSRRCVSVSGLRPRRPQTISCGIDSMNFRIASIASSGVLGCFHGGAARNGPPCGCRPNKPPPLAARAACCSRSCSRFFRFRAPLPIGGGTSLVERLVDPACRRIAALLADEMVRRDEKRRPGADVLADAHTVKGRSRARQVAKPFPVVRRRT